MNADAAGDVFGRLMEKGLLGTADREKFMNKVSDRKEGESFFGRLYSEGYVSEDERDAYLADLYLPPEERAKPDSGYAEGLFENWVGRGWFVDEDKERFMRNMSTQEDSKAFLGRMRENGFLSEEMEDMVMERLYPGLHGIVPYRDLRPEEEFESPFSMDKLPGLIEAREEQEEEEKAARPSMLSYAGLTGQDEGWQASEGFRQAVDREISRREEAGLSNGWLLPGQRQSLRNAAEGMRQLNQLDAGDDMVSRERRIARTQSEAAELSAAYDAMEERYKGLKAMYDSFDSDAYYKSRTGQENPLSAYYSDEHKGYLSQGEAGRGKLKAELEKTGRQLEDARNELKSVMAENLKDRSYNLKTMLVAADHIRQGETEWNASNAAYRYDKDVNPFYGQLGKDAQWESLSEEMTPEAYRFIMDNKDVLVDAVKNLDESYERLMRDEDASAFRRFVQGMQDSFDMESLLTLGISDIAEAVKARNIAKRVAEGNGSDADRAYMEAFSDKMEAAGLYDGGTAYAVGQGFYESVIFMLDMAITGGLAAGLRKGATKGAVKLIGRKTAQEAARESTRLGKAAGTAADWMVGSALSPQTWQGMEERQMQNYMYGRDGNGDFVAYVVTDPESPFRSFTNAWGSNLISRFVERGVGPILSKGSSKVFSFMGKSTQRWTSSYLNHIRRMAPEMIGRLEDAISLQGLGSESLEEIIEQPLQYWLVEMTAREKEMGAEKAWSDVYGDGFFLETFLTCATIQAVFGTPGVVAGTAAMIDNHAMMRKYLSRLDEATVKKLRGVMALEDDNARAQGLAGLLRDAGTDQQRMDILGYAVSRAASNMGLSWQRAEAQGRETEAYRQTLMAASSDGTTVTTAQDKDGNTFAVRAVDGDSYALAYPVSDNGDGTVSLGAPVQRSMSDFDKGSMASAPLETYLQGLSARQRAQGQAEDAAAREQDMAASLPPIRADRPMQAVRPVTYFTTDMKKEKAAVEGSRIEAVADVPEGTAADAPVRVVVTAPNGKAELGVMTYGQLQGMLADGSALESGPVRRDPEHRVAVSGASQGQQPLQTPQWPQGAGESVAQAGTGTVSGQQPGEVNRPAQAQPAVQGQGGVAVEPSGTAAMPQGQAQPGGVAQGVEAAVPAAQAVQAAAQPSENRDGLIGRSLTEAEAEALISSMEANAETAPEMELTPENWVSEFGENGEVDTPIGKVKMGENQLAKMFLKKRVDEFGMVKPTLTKPDVILEEASQAKEGQTAERPSSYLFVKTFNRGGEKIKFYASVTVSKDGMEVVISNHYMERNALEKKMEDDGIVYVKDSVLPIGSDRHLAENPQEGSPDLLPTRGSSESETKGSADSGEKQSLGEKIAAADEETNANPTEGQKQAGNYKKGHVRIGQFDISIENPKGSVRRGVDANGKAWEHTMQNSYGYIRGTEGVDGDHIDVFLSDKIDDWNGSRAFVIDQYNEDGTFDEHKVMLGFNEQEDAWNAYLVNYEDGWADGRRLVITPVNIEKFENWIASSHRKTKPFAEYNGVNKVQIPLDEEGSPMYEQAPVQATWDDLMARNGRDEGKVRYFAQEMKAVKDRELKAERKKKPKGKNAAELQRAMDERQSKIGRLEQESSYWDTVLSMSYRAGEAAATEGARARQAEAGRKREASERGFPAIQARWKSARKEEGMTPEGRKARLEERHRQRQDAETEARERLAGLGAQDKGEPDYHRSGEKGAEEFGIRFRQQGGRGEATDMESKRAAVEALGRKLNVEVVFEDEASLRKQPRQYRTASGWFDRAQWRKDGRRVIHVNLSNTGDAHEAEMTVLHEAVGHIGLRELLGAENYDPFLDMVHGIIPEAQAGRLRALVFKGHPDLARRVGEGNADGKDRETAEAELRRVMADEWLAELAEVGGEPGVWEQIVESFRMLLRRIGFELSLSESDIRALLFESRRNLESSRLPGEAERIREQQEEFREAARLDRIMEADMADMEADAGSEASSFRQWYGGNSGYVGYSMSRRAAEAREEGRFPKTDFKKEYHVSEHALKALVRTGFIDGSEWHHTSKYGNRTPFYGWTDEASAQTYLDNKKEVDALSKEYDGLGMASPDDNAGLFLEERMSSMRKERGYGMDFLTDGEKAERSRRLDEIGIADFGMDEAERARINAASEAVIDEYRELSVRRIREMESEIQGMDEYKNRVEEEERKEARRKEIKGRLEEIFGQQETGPEGVLFRQGGGASARPTRSQRRQAERMFRDDKIISAGKEREWTSRQRFRHGMANLQEFFNDSVRLRYLGNHIRRMGGRVSSATDLYELATTVPAKEQYRSERFELSCGRPLVSCVREILQKTGKKVRDLELYMIAKHGPERNRWMYNRKKLGELADDMAYEVRNESGITRPLGEAAKNRIIASIMKEDGGKDSYMDAAVARKMAADIYEALSQSHAASMTQEAMKAQGKGLSLPKDNAKILTQEDLDGIAEKTQSSLLERAEKDTDTDKDFSGLSDFAKTTGKNPENYVARFEEEVESAVPGGIDSFWEHLNAVTDFTLKTRLECGLMSEEAYQAVKDMGWSHYVPLRSWEAREEESLAYLDMEYPEMMDSEKTRKLYPKKAKGRHSLSAGPMGYIFQAAETAMKEGEKNLYLQAVGRLARENSGFTHLWTVSNAESAEAQRAEAMTLEEIHKTETGREAESHRVLYRVNGEYRYVDFVNPRMAAAVRGDRAMKWDRIWAGKLLKPLRNMTRLMSMLNTSLSSAFAIRNAIRDLQFAINSRIIEDGKRPVASGFIFIWNWMMSLPAAFRSTNDEWVMTSGSKQAELVRLWKENGGETGWHTLKPLNELKRKIVRDMERGELAQRAKDKIEALPRMLQYTAEVLENSVRLAAFKDAMQRGKDAQEAAFYSKEVTTNFNRRSRMANVGGPVYMFLNASIQGLVRYAELFRKAPKAFLGFNAFMFLLGDMVSSMAAAGDDDDGEREYLKMSRYLRYTNWVVGHWTIPLAHGFKLPYGLGAAWREFQLGNMNEGELAVEVMHLFGNELLPGPLNLTTAINYDPSSMEMNLKEGGDYFIDLAPSPLVWYAEVQTNRDFMGNPIKRELYTKDQRDDVAEVARYMPNTNPMLLHFDEKIAGIDGYVPELDQKFTINKRLNGNISWWLDWNPNSQEHMISSLFGSAGRGFMDITRLAGKIYNGEAITARDIPVLNKLYRSTDPEKAILMEYYRLHDYCEFYLNATSKSSKDVALPLISDESRNVALKRMEGLLSDEQYAVVLTFDEYRKKVDELLAMETQLRGYKQDSGALKEVRLEVQALAGKLKLDLFKARDPERYQRMIDYNSIRDNDLRGFAAYMEMLKQQRKRRKVKVED